MPICNRLITNEEYKNNKFNPLGNEFQHFIWRLNVLTSSSRCVELSQ